MIQNTSQLGSLGSVGHLKEFLYDDEEWSIKAIVVDTRNWWRGKRVVIPPVWIGVFDWMDKSVHVQVSRATIRSGPEYGSQAHT